MSTLYVLLYLCTTCAAPFKTCDVRKPEELQRELDSLREDLQVGSQHTLQPQVQFPQLFYLRTGA